LGPAPAYALVNQLGRPVSSRRFAGKVQIVTFLFPYCTTFCPLIAAHLIGFERWLSLAGEENQVAVVAFNLAPEAAGPPQMRAFLGQYGWDPTDPNWQFLTGSQGEIRRVVTQGFHIAYQRVAGADSKSGIALEANEPPQLAVANPLAEKAKVDFDITHDDAIEIVDAKGRIRKIYDDGDVVSNDELWAAVRPLLAHEAGAPGPG
ncbi:MAG: SCO family protein, partial [Caulobacteraceae bacterium]